MNWTYLKKIIDILLPDQEDIRVQNLKNQILKSKIDVNKSIITFHVPKRIEKVDIKDGVVSEVAFRFKKNREINIMLLVKEGKVVEIFIGENSSSLKKLPKIPPESFIEIETVGFADSNR